VAKKFVKKETITSPPIKLRGRLAFLKIAHPEPYEEGAEPRYEATVLLDPASKHGKESILLLFKTAAEVSKQSWEGLVPRAMKKLAAKFMGDKFDPETPDDEVKMAFFDGDIKEYDGYAGMLAVPAHEYKSHAPKGGIHVVNREGVPIDPTDDDYPYSGCDGRIKVTLWGQDNKNGRRIGINLKGVQFSKDNDAFGGGGDNTAPEDAFDALEDDDDESAGGDSWDK